MKDDKSNSPAAFYQQRAISFECTHCGQCCTGKDSYVFVNKREVEKMRKSLNISISAFKKRYLDKHPEGDLVLAQSENGDCVFLHSDKGCEMYKSRPTQCSTYPFWPEILRSKTAWSREAGQCEGINQGKEISLHEITHALSLLSDDPK